MDDRCIDCDHLTHDCICENVLRCSCGIPDEVCVCASGMPRPTTSLSACGEAKCSSCSVLRDGQVVGKLCNRCGSIIVAIAVKPVLVSHPYTCGCERCDPPSIYSRGG